MTGTVRELLAVLKWKAQKRPDTFGFTSQKRQQ